MNDYSTKPFDNPDNDPVAPEQQKILTHADFVWQRIEMIREERNMTKAAFAKSIGLTPGGYQNMIRDDRVSETQAICIEYRHGFDAKWVMTGEGEPKAYQWERLKNEVEDSILRDLEIFFSQKLKRTRPIVLNKDKNARQYR